jgi:hypothetical protein
MMTKVGIKSAGIAAPQRSSSKQAELSEEDRSKDAFFVRVAEIAEAMIARHGKDFAMGTMLLAAKFIAEGKPFGRRTDDGAGNSNTARPV